jgi:hypothetical protein
MSVIVVRNAAIMQARDRLDEAISVSLDALIREWAKANLLTLDHRKLEEAVERLLEGVS